MRDPAKGGWPEAFHDLGEGRYAERWQPACDVFETTAALIVRVELPGVKGEDVRVKVDRDHVRIAGMRHAPPGRDVLRLHRMEIAFGPFERVIAVSRPFDRDSVTAHLEDGFLEITLPMPKGKRQIAVEEG